MMKTVIIIDNFNRENQKFHTRFENMLIPLKESVSWKFIHYTALENENVMQECVSADGIIVTGSYEMLSDPAVVQQYSKVAHLVQNFSNPLLGICFGHQLIASAFGHKIQNLAHPDYNIEQEMALELEFDGRFDLVKAPKIWVYETHHQEIKWSSEYDRDFYIHASSENCKIQAVSHRTRKIYGVQFHPENPTHHLAFQDGLKLFSNFISIL